MNVKQLCGIGWLLVLAGCQTVSDSQMGPAEVVSGARFIDARARLPGDEVVIPYRKYALANGLTLVLHEDNSDPLVHVDVTYHVGSAREQVGKSGFAHFFEHMMFQGSDNVADDEHFKLVAEAGGTMNGSTSSDRTNYYQTVPSNQLEKMLWLEADRMGFLLDAVTQEAFENQRETVKNERGQNYDNRPYGLLSERVGEALYPIGHPYSWSTIGYIEDLDRVDVNDLKRFFKRWYGPNNAVVTIGGKFDEAQVLAWVEKYFGGIPRGPEVAMPEKSVLTLEADRYISMDDNVALPLLYMAFPTVYRFHPDEAPLDVLMYVLGVDETSLLYKNMVKNQVAVQAQASHGCQELACSFTVVALPNPASGKTLADLEQIIRDSLVEFGERGVQQVDLDRVKMDIAAGMIYGLESVAGKVSSLASYETFTGQPDYTEADIARYENVTMADVMRVYNQYIVGKSAVIMSILPREQAVLAAAPDSWQRQPRVLPKSSPAMASSSAVAVDNFDRSVMPPSGANPSPVLPTIWRSTTATGVAVLGAENKETPTTALRLRLSVGQRNETLDTLGLASMTAAMLNESTLKSSNEELSNRLQLLGSSVKFGVDNNYTEVTVRSLSRNLDETLAIMAERLLEPRFDPEEFERLKNQTLQSIEQTKKQPAATADIAYQLLLMGDQNPVAYLNMGSADTVAKLTLDDVKGFYETYYAPSIAKLVVVSDVAQTEIEKKLGILDSWRGAKTDVAKLLPFPPASKTRIYLLDNPGAAQSEIRIGQSALPFDATGDFYRLGLANYPLGGAFNSRINMNLREDKGYTYGARSGFAGEKDYGLFTASAGVRTDSTAASVAEFTRELKDFQRDGMTAEELSFVKNAFGQRDALRFETPGQKLGLLSRVLTYDLAEDFIEQQQSILSGVSAEELNALMAQNVDLDKLAIVVVGDKAVIFDSLAELGYEIVDVDEYGRVL
ncbi:MAG: zinc protease [Candidatus Azotimanducaceae bacterium]|jgi:zinc protease